MGCSPWDRKESGTTEQLTLTLSITEFFSFFAFPINSLPLLLFYIIILLGRVSWVVDFSLSGI